MIRTMDRNRVTSEAVRGMRPGSTVSFGPMTPSEMDSGKTIAYRVGRNTGCRITARSDYEKGILTIRKERI